ncbi:MAG: glycosyltransferase family 87 protein [Candidatus Sulfotelmatobacter sp.]
MINRATQPPALPKRDELHSVRTLRIVLYLLLFAAAAEFVLRAPLRYLQFTNWSDLSQNYAATRIWLRGQNFADPENFVTLWRTEVHSTLDAHTGRTHLAPPPGTLVLMAPIGALPWPAAKIAWLVVLLVSFALTVWALINVAGFRAGSPGGSPRPILSLVKDPRIIAFVAACLALAPFHTGIAAENQTILVVALCTLGIWAATGRRDLAAGLLFGAACSLKPHLGTFIVLYFLLRRRWRLFATAIAFTALLALIAIAWMQICSVSWRADYFHNVKVLATENKIDDFTAANPIRFMLINLQVPFYSFTHQAKSANLLALSTAAVLLALWIYLVLRHSARAPELLSLAAVAVITLLPVYHRFYDASLLAIPLCWSLTALGGRLRHVARAALVLMLPFLVPGAAILQQAVFNHRIPASLSESWAWDGFVMPHQSWLLLALVVLLLYALARESNPESAA